MKPRVVKVDPSPQRGAREVGDAPKLGQVARMEQKPLKPLQGERMRRSEDEAGAEQTGWWLNLLSWTAVILGLLVLLGLMFFWVKKKLGPEAGFSKVEEAAEVADPGPAVASLSVIDPDEAVDLVRRGLAARHIGRVINYFRVMQEADLTEVVHFLEELDDRDGLVIAMEPMEAVEVDGRMLGRVVVVSQKGDSTHRRLALLVEDGEGQWKIDYEAFARVVEPSWPALIDGSVDEGIVRVVVRPPLATDDGRWLVHPLLSPDVRQPLTGRCEAGSPAAKRLAAMLNDTADEPCRVTLAVEPEAGGPRGDFRILRVVAAGWVMPSADDPVVGD